MTDALPLRRVPVLTATFICAGLAVACLVPGAAAQSAPQTPPAKAKPAPKKPKAQAQTPAVAAKQDPVEAQRMLAAGQAALVGGKADTAVENLSAALAGRGLASNDMAKALYLRGAAYRKLAKPALAIADLNGALYIRKGLADVDRKDADEQRAAAYREAGLPDQRLSSLAPSQPASEGPAPSAPRTTGSLAAAAGQAAPAAAAAAPQAAPAAPSSGGPLSEVGTFFGSLFGTSASASKATAPVQAAEVSNQAGAQNAVSSWSTSTKPGAAATVPTEIRTAAVPAASAPVAAPAPPAAAAQVLMQLANLRDRAEAEAVAERVKLEYASDLGARTVVVAENIAGSFGRLYAVRVGPFASADESRALCTRFRKQGLDCLAISSR